MNRHLVTVWVPCALLLLAACGVDALGAAQGAYLRAVFRDILRLEPPPLLVQPASSMTAPFEGSSDADTAAPRHMMELYRRYASGGAPRRRQGTTVRSIAPVSGRDRWPGEMLVFNVSAAAAPGEEVTRAHLHLRRRRASAPRRHRGRALAPPARVRLLPLDQGGRGPSSLAALPVAGATRGGWEALDVTAALRELLLLPTTGRGGGGGGGGQRNGGRRGGGGAPLLGVRFEAPRGRALPPHAFLQGDSPAHAAFLIVFSEDDVPGTGDGVPRKASVRGPAHTHAIAEMLQSVGAVVAPSAQEPPTKAPPAPDADFYLEPDDEETTNLVDAPPSRGAEDEEGNNMLAALPALPQRPPHRPRRPRSVLDNELPGANAQPPAPPRTTPESVLSPRRPPPQPAVPGRPPPPPPPASTLPMPGGGTGGRRGGGRRGGRGRGRRRGGEHKKRGRQRLDSAELREREYLPDLNRSDFGLSANASSGNGGGFGGSGGARNMPLCQRKKLVVDFNDIGWGQFIVAPRSFEAHYCAGDCPFPIAKALRPTNHATLQSLVRALGRAPGVPAPCCVPDHLSSLSLLYLDSAGNVVLKNYPNMAVDSCACR